MLPVSDYSADSRFLTSTKQHYSLYNKEISDRIRQRCLQSSDINKALHGGRSVTNYQETLPPVTRHRLDYRPLVLENGPSSHGVIRRIRDRSGPSRLVSLYSWSCLMQPKWVQNTCKYFYDVYQGFWRIWYAIWKITVLYALKCIFIKSTKLILKQYIFNYNYIISKNILTFNWMPKQDSPCNENFLIAWIKFVQSIIM